MNFEPKFTKLTGLTHVLAGTALAAAALFALSTAAQSESKHLVTLVSLDGNVELIGEITGIEGTHYVLTNTAGVYRVSGDDVRCSGLGCPTRPASTSVFASPPEIAFAFIEAAQ